VRRFSVLPARSSARRRSGVRFIVLLLVVWFVAAGDIGLTPPDRGV
jgi:hypothetical protein